MARKKKNNSDSDKNKSAKAAEERRDIVISSVNFWNELRNQALFRVSNAKLKKKIAEKELNAAKAQARLAKKRLFSEIENNLDILKSGDTNNFYIEEDTEE